MDNYCHCGGIPSYERDGTDERWCHVCVNRLVRDNDVAFDASVGELDRDVAAMLDRKMADLMRMLRGWE
jgi:hypothetical protein